MTNCHFLFSDEGKEYLLREYVENKKSTRQIAESQGTYPNMVNRAMQWHGIPTRTHAEAQKIVAESGKHPHPTRGRKRSQDERERIALGVAKYWKRLSNVAYDKRAAAAKKRWESLTESQREGIRASAIAGLQEAAKNGSKLEKYLTSSLMQAGFEVHLHSVIHASVIADIAVRSPLRVAIFVDGPSHHLPIWGQDRLERTIEADYNTNHVLAAAGVRVVRVKHITRNVSAYQKRSVFQKLVTVLRESDEMLVEIEVG